jgi:hypothetical protein
MKHKFRYSINSLGYQNQVEYNTIEEARAALREMVEGDLIDCRRRYGSACKVETGKDSYTVKVGNAQSVSVWSSHSIVKLLIR